jgi:predicted ribosome quality control (RQC) complex YloA/Tae2 family protein
MSLNWQEIDAVLAELNLGGRWLRKVRQPDFRRIILEFSSGADHSAIALVLVSPYVRIHRLAPESRLPRALPKPPRFTAVLKSRIEGLRLSSLRQIGCDRIVRFTFERGGEPIYLDAKLWGNGANLILSGPDGIILDTYSRRPKRGEAPGEMWPPEDIGRKQPDPNRYPLRNLPGEGDWNSRVEIFYRQLEADQDRESRIELWEAHLDRREAALKVKEQRIQTGQNLFQTQLKDGHWADIIMAHLHELSRGSKELEADDWDSPGSVVCIPLDPKLSPRDNAEAYYKRQKRASRGLKRLGEDRQILLQTRKNIGELRSRIRDGKTLSDPFDSDPPDRKIRGNSTKDNLPGLWITRTPFLIVVGRNAKESDALLRRWARGNNLWLHARDYPGGHVFIRPPRGKSIPLDVLLDAGNLAVSYSKGKNSGEIDLYYTQVKHLRRPKDGKAGTVLPNHEKNLRVKLDPERLTSLKASAETA